METGDLPDDEIAMLIAQRKVFPCYFGAALKTEGVDAFLAGLSRYAPIPVYGEAFGARVFKITRDAQGARLTHMKITGGTLRVKTPLTLGEGESAWSEKADQLRLYSGEKFTLVEEAEAGCVVAVTGLSHTRAGQGLGAEEDWPGATLTSVMTYRVELPDGTDVHTAAQNLRRLEEEEAELHVSLSHGEIHVGIMGEVQMEVLQRLISERFGMDVRFSEGTIRYRETIAASAEGLGHFEPLRHYAEVHLLLEPAPRGSGITLASECSEDRLDRNWQRLIFTHLLEKEHAGVLIGAPLTDVKITLLGGRAHVKHTEGGDFRQATYRAVRHALMRAQSVLLEPWYDFRLELPAAQVGRAMTDLQRTGGTVNPPETNGEETVLTGSAPVSALRDYALEVRAYTRGTGKLTLTPAEYRECPRAAEVIAASGYDPERDVDNPADSVFCEHGSGVIVPWREVMERARAERTPAEEAEEETAAPRARAQEAYRATAEQDKELLAIFERTYGAVKPRQFVPPRAPKRAVSIGTEKREIAGRGGEEEYLLADGYNLIFAWEELKRTAAESLDAARKQLCEMLCNYQGYRKCRVIAVFDAYKVKGGTEHVENYHNITVVYTKEAETADAYIERTTYALGKQHRRVKVATSDAPEQMIILGHGALRVSASAFRAEMDEALRAIGETVTRNNLAGPASGALRSALEEAIQKEK